MVSRVFSVFYDVFSSPPTASAREDDVSSMPAASCALRAARWTAQPLSVAHLYVLTTTFQHRMDLLNNRGDPVSRNECGCHKNKTMKVFIDSALQESSKTGINCTYSNGSPLHPSVFYPHLCCTELEPIKTFSG